MYYKFGQHKINRKMAIVNFELRLLQDSVYGPHLKKNKKQADTVSLSDAFLIPQYISLL